MITTQTSKIEEARRLAERRDALLRIKAELDRIALDDKTGLFLVANQNPVLANDAAVTLELIQMLLQTQAPEMYNVMLTIATDEIAAAETEITDELTEGQQQP